MRRIAYLDQLRCIRSRIHTSTFSDGNPPRLGSGHFALDSGYLFKFKPMSRTKRRKKKRYLILLDKAGTMVDEYLRFHEHLRRTCSSKGGS
jgi:hypothetical protein